MGGADLGLSLSVGYPIQNVLPLKHTHTTPHTPTHHRKEIDRADFVYIFMDHSIYVTIMKQRRGH